MTAWDAARGNYCTEHGDEFIATVHGRYFDHIAFTGKVKKVAVCLVCVVQDVGIPALASAISTSEVTS